MASIHTLTTTCLALFKSIDTLISTSPSSPHFQNFSPLEFEEARGRLNLWVYEYDAHRLGTGGFDHGLRLQRVNFMRDAVMELLRQLEANLRESLEVLSGKRKPFETWTAQDLARSEDDDIEPADLERARFERSELRERMERTMDIVSGLYKLGVTLRSVEFDKMVRRAETVEEERLREGESAMLTPELEVDLKIVRTRDGVAVWWKTVVRKISVRRRKKVAEKQR